MKNKLYYWVAIVVLVLSNAFFVVTAQIQGGYAREAMEEAQQSAALAAELQVQAEQQAILAAQQAQVAQESALAAQAEAMQAQQALRDCEGSK